MLNGAHSTLAYAGLLAEKTYVYEAVADPTLLARARGIMAEAQETLEGAARDTAGAYAAQLEKRFANVGMKHELRQIAMDGSLKIPVRILKPLSERLAQGKASPFMEASLATWAYWIAAEIQAGKVISDPAYERLKQACAPAPSLKAMAACVLKDEQIFGSFFKEHPQAFERIFKNINSL